VTDRRIEGTATAPQGLRQSNKAAPRDVTGGAFFWLSAFYVVYCVRPEDWIPGLANIPMAKISAIFAMIALVSVIGRTKRTIKDMPAESNYLLAMILLLFVWAPLSTVWKGGAINHTTEFAKVYVAWALTFLLATSLERLRRLIFIQAGSVAVIAVVSVLKGSSHPRLEGALGGIYSNPNDLAFAIVLTIPFIFLLLLTTKNVFLRALWALTLPVMLYTLFRTASRAGFIDLMISVPVLLWFFAIKGRRPYLIVITVVVGGILLIASGKQLRERISAVSGSDLETSEDTSAYGSFEERKFLMKEAVEGIVHYPLTGVGTGNFVSYSGKWKQVHMTYLEITVEGGIPVAILYLMFFSSGFRNLKKLRKRRDLDPQATLFVGALFTSLLGFVVGACFAPEAYQFFPYFTVAYISALLATVKEKEKEAGETPAKVSSERRFRGVYANDREPRAVPAIR